MKFMAQNFSSITGPPNMPKTVLNLSDELTRVHRPQKISWNWILKKSPKFDFWTHLGSDQLSSVWKVGKSGGLKVSNFQKYRGTVRESSYKFFLLFTGLWAIDGTKLWSFGHLHMTPSAKNQPKMAYGPFWAIFEKPDFLTIFEASYDPKQWSYLVFSAKIVFSAVDYPYTSILSPTSRDIMGFSGPQKVLFSAFKVGTQEIWPILSA